MNKDRRAEIEEIKTKIESLIDDVESAKQGEEDYYDNMPDAIQQGDKGDAAQEVISELDSALDCLNSAVNHLTTAAE